MLVDVLLFVAAAVITPQSEIVAATNAPYATRLAAKELNFFLKGIFDCELPIVGARTEGRSAIVLGRDGEGAVATRLSRDAFVSHCRRRQVKRVTQVVV